VKVDGANTHPPPTKLGEMKFPNISTLFPKIYEERGEKTWKKHWPRHREEAEVACEECRGLASK